MFAHLETRCAHVDLLTVSYNDSDIVDGSPTQIV